MGVFVKICGLARGKDVEAVAALRPDALGFIFWAGSPRAVEPGAVADWTRGIPAEILKVGVFVDAEIAVIQRAREVAGLDVVQLHGRESPALAQAIPGRVWKAVHLEKEPDPARFAGSVDAVLIDGYSGHAPGGTGVVADWARATKLVSTLSTPILLAGGLRPENIEAAIHAVAPWGVDVSSGVESEPGKKQISKVEAFIQSCRKNS